MRYLWLVCFCFVFSCFAQQQTGVNFLSAKVQLTQVAAGQVSGSVLYQFKTKTAADSIYLNAQQMTFKDIRLNQKSMPYQYQNNLLSIKHRFKKNTTYQLLIQYTAQPRQTVYFTQNGPTQDTNHPNYNPTQIWTQGQGKYTSHWLPSLDDVTDKVEFDISITTKAGLRAIANGALTAVDTLNNGQTTWHYNMQKPMSSYLAAFAIGQFDQLQLYANSGVPISLYYPPKDSLRAAPTYRYTKDIFNFLEKEIGIPYPWQNYKQVPVQDFLYAGMENTGCTIFSNQYLIDTTAFVDKNYVNVNAHELAHQWFGNLVTAQSSADHWLHEGFATYYAYLAEQQLFGKDHFYWTLYHTAQNLSQRSKDKNGQALIDPQANSLTFYEKGAWALVALRERVGDSRFKKGVRHFLQTHAYQNTSVADFISAMEKASNTNLGSFKAQWLDNTSFPWAEAKSILSKNCTSLHTYFKLKASLGAYPNRLDPLLKLWDGLKSMPLQVALIKDFKKSLVTKPFLEKLEQSPIKVRQAMLVAVDSIPAQFQKHFEGYLKDPSYITQETALFKLWQAFPTKRSAYLNDLEGVIGLPNKNVRQLWLALALITEGYQPFNKTTYYQELNNYTAPHYNFEIRQLAFQYLWQIGGLNDAALKNLIQACGHPVWQFKKSSRHLLREIYATGQGKQRLSVLELSQAAQNQLNKILHQ